MSLTTTSPTTAPTSTQATAQATAPVTATQVPTPTVDPLVPRAGRLLGAGALAWAGCLLTVGGNPDTLTGSRVLDASALVFQLGAIALVTAMARTAALGPGRGARVGLVVERVLLALASVWTVLHLADPVWADETTWVLVLDVFWPLSMLGMLFVGIKLFRARRWAGPLRTAPLIAETWAPIAIGSLVVGDLVGLEHLGNVVGGLHLVVGYARLGWLLHRRPELTLGQPT